MKTYRYLICVFGLLLISGAALGQKTIISVGGNIAVPTAYGIKRVAGTGVGGSFRVETAFGKQTYGMATVEYLTFAKKTSYQQTANFTAIPFQVGLKYYTSRKTEDEGAHGLFLSGEVGIMPAITRFTYSGGRSKFKESGVSAAPGLGYQSGRIEASIRPQFNLSASGFKVYYFNSRLAYALLKKRNQT